MINWRPSVKDRFIQYVLFDEGCWLWAGKTFSTGYGRFSMRRKSILAHRAAWEIFRGTPPPANMLVMHSCDNPICVCPDHLSLGTTAENAQDTVRKGRSLRGERNTRSRLGPDDVVIIRALHGRETNASIARRYGVKPASIWAIQHRKTWAHI